MRTQAVSKEKQERRSTTAAPIKSISMDDLNNLAKKVEDQDGEINLSKLVDELKKMQNASIQ